MTSQNLKEYDFKVPGGLCSDTAHQFKLWMTNFANLFKEKWSAIVPSDLEVKFQSDAAFSFSNLKERMPRPSIGYRVVFTDAKIESLLVMERKAALSIVMEMTGDPAEEIEDRDFSTVELSLFEMFINEIVATHSESWIDQKSLFMETRGVELLPHRSRIFSPRTLMLSLKFNVIQQDNTFDLFWYVPQGDFGDLLSETETAPAQQEASRMQLESLTDEMKVKLAVCLGKAEITFSQMEALNVGDVIVFDQKITEPLAVTVEELAKFKAWPGRHGNNQAIKISELVS